MADYVILTLSIITTSPCLASPIVGIGLFAATGIPITAMVVGNLVKTWISHMGRTKMASYLRRKIHDAEFEVLRYEHTRARTSL